MTIAEQFPFEFDGADVTLNRLGGGIGIEIDHDSLNRPLYVYVKQPDEIDGQLMNEGMITYE